MKRRLFRLSVTADEAVADVFGGNSLSQVSV